MKIIDLQPSPEKQIRFHLRLEKDVPTAAGCYALVSFDFVVLYIGLSKNLLRRFREHLDCKEKIMPTQDGKAFWFYYRLCEENDLEMLERTWLKIACDMDGRRPILNCVDSPVS